MERFIVSIPDPSAGLSNRIKCILSALRLCECFSQKPLLYWPQNIACAVKFSDLFETKIPQLDEKDLDKIKKTKDFSYCSSYSDFIKNKHKYSLLDTWRFMLLPTDVAENFARVFPDESGKNIDLEYERIPMHLREEYLKYIKKLTPSKFIRQEVSNFLRKQDLNKVVGVHARRREFMVLSDGRGKVSSDEKFFERISSIIAKNPKSKFFLATDSEETQEKFIKKFGDHIIVYPNKDFRRNTDRSVKDALIDILLLSKTNHILGTYLSSFTELAWWFGGCKAKVEIIGDEKEKQKVLNKNQERFNPKTLKGLIRKTIKFFINKSVFLTKLHEKRIDRKLDKWFLLQK